MACAEVSQILATYKPHGVTETAGLQTDTSTLSIQPAFCPEGSGFLSLGQNSSFSFYIIFTMIILV